MKFNRKRTARSLLMRLSLALALFCLPAPAFGQTNDLDTFAGSYKGMAKTNSGEMNITLELEIADHKVAGHARAADTDYQITSSKVTDGALTITLGPDPATLTLRKSGEKLVGDWVHGAQKATVELAKSEPAADLITGQWDAVADAQGQPFPFKLTLKLDGDKVTGSSDSDLGHSPISSGAWKDGKLSILLEGSAGQIALVATMIDSKLSGDYDFAGQLQGKWVAIRKK